MRARLGLLWIALLGCEAEAPARTETSEASASTSVREPVPDVANADAGWRPGPARKTTHFDPDRLALDRECRSCHVEANASWQHSQHASAWSSRAFQRAFASEPQPFCQRCHAPETNPREQVSAGASELGVGCVTCHVPPGSDSVWAGVGPESATAPHAIVRAAWFEQPQACARCHEFEFPGGALRDRPLLMQSTLSEHRASAAADQTCVDCHMPREGEGERSHAFPGAYEQAMLQRSLTISVTRPRAELVRIELLPREVGHDVPTGDLLRRLEVALVHDHEGREQVVARAWLGREFEERRQSNGVEARVERADRRVGAAGQIVELELPRELEPATLRWRVRHERVATHARNPRSAAIEGYLDIASGSLPCPIDQPECAS